MLLFIILNNKWEEKKIVYFLPYFEASFLAAAECTLSDASLPPRPAEIQSAAWKLIGFDGFFGCPDILKVNWSRYNKLKVIKKFSIKEKSELIVLIMNSS
jgi:hypothetical protein